MAEYNEEYTRWLEQNILNIGYAHFEHNNIFDIPSMLPSKLTKEDIQNSKLQGFNYALQEKKPENLGVHFFLHDYQFERVWRFPDRYTQCLSKFKYTLAPDFSPFANLPYAIRIFNIYRKMWCARYWQENDIEVIPTFTLGDDEVDWDLCTSGFPKNSIIATSTMGEGRWGDYKGFFKNWDRMIETLQPKIVLLYGKDISKDLGGCEIVHKLYATTKQ